MLILHSSLTLWAAAALYTLATLGAAWQLKPPAEPDLAARSLSPLRALLDLCARATLPLGLLALIAHSAYALVLSFDFNESALVLNLSVASMTALISVILVATFLCLCRFMTLIRLAVIVFPLTILSLLFSYLWSSDPGQTLLIAHETSTSLKLHILTSMLAYTFIAISAIQAIVYTYQESQLKKRVRANILAVLPPLETMESLIFRLLLIGFALLTITLLTGSVFSQALFNVPVEFSHHTVFALLAWFLSAWVLAARLRSGLSGGQAMPWIIAAFLCMQLGYFGSKIILELLN